MLAIFSNTLENADRLSESLQHYWSTQGVYQSILRYETEEEFMKSMYTYHYECVILDCLKNPFSLIVQIRNICPYCRIGVIADTPNRAKDNEVALACAKLNVDIMLSLSDIERPFAMLSKKLDLTWCESDIRY